MLPFLLREREMERRNSYKDAVLFISMVGVEWANVGLNILFKAATIKGMSNYVFILYSCVFTTLVLLPLTFIFPSSTRLPSFKFSLLSRICLLGLVGSLIQIVGYKGLAYSSPTLASIISNLTPAFTFFLAIIFRMEKIALRSLSTQAKIIGTVVSISGAMMVVLYKGPPILSSTSSSTVPSQSLQWSLESLQSKWIIGGILLLVEKLFVSIFYIIQTQIVKLYPAELVVALLYCLSSTIICAPICLMAESNLSAWRLKPDIELATIVYSAFFGLTFITVVHTFSLHMKGPVYTAAFKPLSIVIAAIMSFIVLGEALHLGSVIGGVTICIGFYVVIWGKANEEEINEGSCFTSLGASEDSETSLL